MNLNRPTVLLLSSDPAFSRSITDAWPHDLEGPEFIQLEIGLSRALQPDTYDLAITETSSSHQVRPLAEVLAAAGKPAIVVCSDAGPSMLRDFSSMRGLVLVLNRERETWPGMVGLLGREILRRCQAESAVRHAEKDRGKAETEATLGRYMSEMRNVTSNALTSILGNAELLLLEPGLPAKVLSQADTIRNMALRLHEIFQRFSSIEKELSVAARESVKETGHARAASV